MHAPGGTSDSIKYESNFEFSIYSAATNKFEVEYSNQVSSER